MAIMEQEADSMHQINETYRIAQDNLNYILQKKSTSRKGGAGTWHTIGYYQTIKQLYNALIELHIRGSSLCDLEALNRKVEGLHSMVEKMPLHKNK